jgi:CheY-like chemotaxis protein
MDKVPMKKVNCWEFKHCGRAFGEKNALELGVCPASMDIKFNGVHSGLNAGRACWYVAGTFCEGEIRGTFAQQIRNCEKCDFHDQVKKEEYSRYFHFSQLSTEKIKILVVEDEAIIALDLQMRLRGYGYGVPSVVSTGEDAIRLSGDEKPKLVLMDIMLPGEIDGIEAANQIRLQFDIPVIYLTAYVDESTMERARKSRPFGYLIKPVEDVDLISSLNMAIYINSLKN